MNERELQIWAATFAANFVTDTRAPFERGRSWPDRHEREDIADESEAMADWAVEAFRAKERSS